MFSAMRAVEHLGVLGDVGNGPSHAGLGASGDVLPIDQDPPTVDFHEPQHQPGDRRFATP